MTARRLLIVGAGGHGAVAADCAQESGHFDEVVFLDDRWPEVTRRDGWSVVARANELMSVVAEGDSVFVAVGDARHRGRFISDIKKQQFRLATIVHPRAVISCRAELGLGCLVVAGSVINVGAQIGDACIVNSGATVDHHSVLDALVHVCPGAHVGGDVRVGARSWLGIGCAVKHGVTIGDDVVVGAGAVVVSDVPSSVTVVGVPARVVDESA